MASRAKSYTCSLVGEQYFPNATKGLRIGDPVFILHEIGNPHDPGALVAVTENDVRLGYVAKDYFLQRVLHEDGDGVHATLLEIDRSGPFPQVRLSVRVVPADDPDNGFDEIDYTPAPAPAAAPAAFTVPDWLMSPTAFTLGTLALLFLLVKLFS